MEPRIQYARTKDGVSIAYRTLGEGRPLVLLAQDIAISHLQLEWQTPPIRRWQERLAEARMLVRFDPRGHGLSDREVADYSFDAFLLDVDAVADRLSLERFALAGSWSFGMAAVAYAARHPDRVSRLILWCSATRSSDLMGAKQVRALRALVDVDWETATETWARVAFGESEAAQARAAAAFIRESITPDAMARIWALPEVDIRPLLPHLATPTLVLSPRRTHVWDMLGLARDLASRIPDARLAVLEGNSTAPWEDAEEAALAVINEFLSEDEGSTPIPSALPSGTAVILFADIAESTALTERLGDAAFRQKARDLDTALRGVIGECGGTPVEGKLLGDGVLAVFTSARQAIEAALSCGRAGDAAGLPLHLGIHAGDVIREENNVYGGAVNIAARIAAASAPGQVLVSDTVRGLARTSAGVTFEDRGEHELKGVGEPQRLYEVKPCA